MGSPERSFPPSSSLSYFRKVGLHLVETGQYVQEPGAFSICQGIAVGSGEVGVGLKLTSLLLFYLHHQRSLPSLPSLEGDSYYGLFWKLSTLILWQGWGVLGKYCLQCGEWSWECQL